MEFNPTVLVFWGFTALVGFLAAGTLFSTLFGLAAGLGISLLVSIFLE